MKIKTTVHVHFQKYSFEENGQFVVFSCKMENAGDHYTYVGPQEIEVEVPENYDPRPQQVAALEKKKQQVMAEFQKTVDEINDRISKLQALEYTA